MKPFLVLGIIFVVAVGAVLLQFSRNQDLSELATPLYDISFGHSDAISPFAGQAISLVRTGTFNYGGPGYVGLTQRGPVYAVMLAGSFLLFGERVWSVLAMNIALLLAAIFFIWRVSARLLPAPWSFAPPALTALFWEISAFATMGSYEMAALAFSSFTLLSLLRYYDTRRIFWLLGGALAMSFWTLEKPIVLYMIPFAALFILIVQWSYMPRRILFTHVVVFVLLASTVIGAWSLRNHAVLDTYGLGTGGIIFLRRASQADFSLQEIISMGLSFTVGDYLGAKLYDGFPRNERGLPAEPKTWDPAIEQRLHDAGFYARGNVFSWMVTDHDGSQLTRVAFDNRLFEEAEMKMKERPLKFFLVGILNLFRLNAPMNYGGQEMMHMFAESHLSLPAAVKIGIAGAVRSAWLLFLALVLYGMMRHVKDWRTWGLLGFVVLYYNIMYAMFTHAEVRYVLTVLPFYFIFLTDILRSWHEWYVNG